MTQKKHLLFVMESLRIGGAEKSLLTILSMLDYDRYDVDLFLFRHSGEFMPFLPPQVNLLPEDKTFQCFDRNRKKAPIEYLKRKDWNAAWHSIQYLAGAGASRILKKPLYIGWNHQKYFFGSLPQQEYDVAIGFLERRTIYYVVDLVKAKKKIGFVHNDYSVYAYDEQEDTRCFAQYNAIATVSEHCEEVLVEKFPEYKDKFTVIRNMVSKEMIETMAQEPIPGFTKEPNVKYLVSVGRLTPQKGFDIAIKVCKRLVEDGVNVRWYIVGEGEQRAELEKSILENKLQNLFVLVGVQVNPYKWMKMCDVYVQPSRFEGFGITVAEANVLRKPIVCADIPEFREQLGSRERCFCTGETEYTENIKQIGHIDPSGSSDSSEKTLEKLQTLIDS